MGKRTQRERSPEALYPSTDLHYLSKNGENNRGVAVDDDADKLVKIKNRSKRSIKAYSSFGPVVCEEERVGFVIDAACEHVEKSHPQLANETLCTFCFFY